MENASKALLMAAGVLIGILILSLAVYLFASFGSTSAELHKQKEEQQINQFNTQFTSYVEKEEVNIYDVVTVANLATETNIYYEFPKTKATGKDNYISVYLKGNNIEGGYGDNMVNFYNQLISENIANDGTLMQYNCQVEISGTTKRVYKVIFTEK